MDMKEAMAWSVFMLVLAGIVIGLMVVGKSMPVPEPEPTEDEMIYFAALSLRQSLYESDTDIVPVITPTGTIQFDKERICRSVQK